MTLLTSTRCGYDAVADAKSSVGRRNPVKQRRTSAPIMTALFLCPSVMAALRGRTSVRPVSFVSGIPTPRNVATQSRRKDRGDSLNKGVTNMTKLRLSLAHIRAKAHRRMAFAALHADSSLTTRLARYQHHIDLARRLEAQEVSA